MCVKNGGIWLTRRPLLHSRYQITHTKGSSAPASSQGWTFSSSMKAGAMTLVKKTSQINETQKPAMTSDA